MDRGGTVMSQRFSNVKETTDDTLKKMIRMKNEAFRQREKTWITDDGKRYESLITLVFRFIIAKIHEI